MNDRAAPGHDGSKFFGAGDEFLAIHPFHAVARPCQSNTHHALVIAWMTNGGKASRSMDAAGGTDQALMSIEQSLKADKLLAREFIVGFGAGKVRENAGQNEPAACSNPFKQPGRIVQ